MRYHEMVNTTIVLLLCSGVYLPRVRKVINNNSVVNLFLVLSVIPAVSIPTFSTSVSIPLFMPGMNLMERLFALVSGISCISATFKLYFCYWNRDNIERIFDVWDESCDDVLYPDVRKKMLLKAKRTTDRWTIAFGSALTGSAAFYATWPMFSRKIEHMTAISYSTESPGFEIFVIYELVAQCYICLFVHSYNCFVMQNVAFEEAMCHYLQLSLARIIDSLKVRDNGEISFSEENLPPAVEGKEWLPKTRMLYHEACAETERKIRIWIRQHQNLLRFHRELQSLLHIPLCVEFFGLVMIICIVLFMIVNNSLSAVMVFISTMYCFNVYTIFYVTCYYGDLAQQLSQSLHEEAFGESWYIYPRKLRTAFYFIVMRCRKPMNLVAFVIYPLNSGTFAKIFRHAYSFFMFLVQVIHRSRD